MGASPKSAIRLTRQVSAGPDGARYRATDEAGRQVIVERLFLAQRQPARWEELTQRLELARRLEHRAVVAPLTYALGARDPYIVKPTPPTNLGEKLAAERPRRAMALGMLRQLADAISAGHRLGLAHTAICPTNVYLQDDGQVGLDFARAKTGEPEPTQYDLVCRPSSPRGHLPDDVFALGALALSLLLGRAENDPKATEALEAPLDRLAPLLAEMLEPDAHARPAMYEVMARLRRAETTEIYDDEATTQELEVPVSSQDLKRIGRFRLVSVLGEGGMGRVYEAVDELSGDRVAVKVLLPHWSQHTATLKRFYREAQVMAELDNPYVARFYEVNRDQGLHYLAMEFIAGRSLDDWLDAQGAPPVDVALGLVRDVARALADVHDLGVVHRDVKPANILLLEEEGAAPRVKLCDFGIALTTGPGDEKVTRAGVTVGTPQYMSPEQCVGAEVDAATDVYALGVTLYRLLAGRVPFDSRDSATVVYQHLREDIPDIRGFCPDLDPEVVSLLSRMLEKDPEARIADARTLLEALERVQRGAPNSMDQHPRRPDTDKVLRYPFQWQLRSPPEALWPHVSDTERLNRAIGLGAVDYHREVVDGVVQTRGQLKMNGVALAWREHAYEWVAPRRLGILREFTAGPFVWFRSTVELDPQGDGTLLTHTVEVEPRGMIGRAAAAMEVGFKAKKSLEKVYRRIDRFVQESRAGSGRSDETVAMGAASAAARPVETAYDAFEPAEALSPEQRARLDQAEERLLDEGLDPSLSRQLVRHLRLASAQDVARIRPRVLARHHELDHREVLRACLLGTKAGLLDMLWDVICPRCRIPADVATSLAALRNHHHCEACALDFDLDFGESVEIIFRAHPAIRPSELGTYCIGGPGHTPHVVAQVQLAPDERFAIDLSLDEGAYLVMGRQMPVAWEFRVERGAELSTWEVPLAEGIPPGTPRVLSPDGQRIVICNDTSGEVVARIERASGRRDAVTAAEAASSATFRQLFPDEALAPGRMLAVQRLTVLTAALSDPWSHAVDEQQVLGRIGALHQAAEQGCAKEGGAVVKIHRDGILATFTDPAAALRVAEHLLRGLDTPICAATEMGSALATSINDRLDYFGRVMHDVDRLLDRSGPGQVVLGETLSADPAAARWLAEGRVATLVEASAGLVGHAVTIAS